jgi:hypothetical protein
VKACEDYFNKLKPGLAGGTNYNLQEQYTINHLCETRSANLSQLAEELEHFPLRLHRILRRRDSLRILEV